MAERTYKVTWLMPLGMGGGYGVKEHDMPKGMDNAGNQGEWLNNTEYGMAVGQSLKSAGFEAVDVRECPVFMQRKQGRMVYWVPYARWWQHTPPADYKLHYIPVRVEPSGDGLQGQYTSSEEGPEEPEASIVDGSTSRLGDAKLAMDYLQSIGWSKQKIGEILEGPATREISGEESENGQPAEAPKPRMRTYEVYGVLNGKSVNLMRVLAHHGGRWHVLPGAGVRATAKAEEGMGLAGSPGKWQEYYPSRRPAEYGLDPNKGVLYWEPIKGRALAASTMLLWALFGRNWRSKVYDTAVDTAMEV